MSSRLDQSISPSSLHVAASQERRARALTTLGNLNDPTVTYALQIGDQESRLPDHARLADAMLRAVGEAQLGETVTLLRVEEGPQPRRLVITALATIGPVTS